MSIRPRTFTTLLALAAMALALLPAAGAVAASGPGGAAAPSGTASASSHKMHSSAIATWFGPGFYGQTTACGQTLTPAVIGLANRTLPCGTLVKVTYHGRALTVPVLDRGPYSNTGADWDLTSGAAEALGISDTVRIGTRVVGTTPNTPTLGLPAVPAASALSGGALAG
ncbi:MAG TPA: septal ring lytic transglycosylase RlpA family protein [Solirubrobacteraceae bacterium]|nr:septal ring lytic transglycosylase RlpA family protein [Solirubrobacteraceae bacterium]